MQHLTPTTKRNPSLDRELSEDSHVWEIVRSKRGFKAEGELLFLLADYYNKREDPTWTEFCKNASLSRKGKYYFALKRLKENGYVENDGSVKLTTKGLICLASLSICQMGLNLCTKTGIFLSLSTKATVTVLRGPAEVQDHPPIMVHSPCPTAIHVLDLLTELTPLMIQIVTFLQLKPEIKYHELKNHFLETVKESYFRYNLKRIITLRPRVINATKHGSKNNLYDLTLYGLFLRWWVMSHDLWLSGFEDQRRLLNSLAELTTITFPLECVDPNVHHVQTLSNIPYSKDNS